MGQKVLQPGTRVPISYRADNAEWERILYSSPLSLPLSLPGEQNPQTIHNRGREKKQAENILTNENKQTNGTEKQFLYLHVEQHSAVEVCN